MSDAAFLVLGVVGVVAVFGLVVVFALALAIGKGLWFKGRWKDGEVGLATLPADVATSKDVPKPLNE